MTLQPLNGFTKKVADMPDRPNRQLTTAEVKAQFDAAPEELRVFVNNIISQLNADFALKQEINNIVLGQINDGSLPDIKLSNDAGQIKDRLAKDITDLANFKAEKAQPNGIATLDANGILAQLPYVTGTYTGNGVNGRLIDLGFRPSAVLVAAMGGKQFEAGTNNYFYALGGLVTAANPTLTGSTLTILSIQPTGFNVYSGSDASSITNYSQTNANNGVYTYMAWK
ncbi:hypothetical protein D0469_07000 [Peribacillus saganii]|uniref:Tail fiber protein n=1 Tax=Peribacillus saganii TaxID=2303992 RepID=A0A372LQ53_9BACI|nr:hypothetical protein [Peribacillus saganii]RFU70341.1 hypothetical protein D0469_07000 [Peribacillus saganii]